MSAPDSDGRRPAERSRRGRRAHLRLIWLAENRPDYAVPRRAARHRKPTRRHAP